MSMRDVSSLTTDSRELAVTFLNKAGVCCSRRALIFDSGTRASRTIRFSSHMRAAHNDHRPRAGAAQGYLWQTWKGCRGGAEVYPPQPTPSRTVDRHAYFPIIAQKRFARLCVACFGAGLTALALVEPGQKPRSSDWMFWWDTLTLGLRPGALRFACSCWMIRPRAVV